MGDAPKKERQVDRKERMKMPFQDVIARPVEERIQDFEGTF